MTKIKTLKNWNEDHTKREPIAPRTHIKAVFDDEGNTLDSLMAVQDEKLSELGSKVTNINHTVFNEHIEILSVDYVDGYFSAVGSSPGKFVTDNTRTSTSKIAVKEGEKYLITTIIGGSTAISYLAQWDEDTWVGIGDDFKPNSGNAVDREYIVPRGVTHIVVGSYSTIKPIVKKVSVSDKPVFYTKEEANFIVKDFDSKVNSLDSNGSAIIYSENIDIERDNLGYLPVESTNGVPAYSSTYVYSDFIKVQPDKLYRIKVVKYSQGAAVAFYNEPSFDSFVSLAINDNTARLVDEYISVPLGANYMVVFSTKKEVMSVSSYDRIRAASSDLERIVYNIQEQLNNGVLNGLLANTVNIFDKNSDYLEKKQLYVNSSGVIVDAYSDKAWAYFLRVGKGKAGKYYTYKVFDDTTYDALSLIRMGASTSFEVGGTMIIGISNDTLRRGYVKPEEDSNLYLKVNFKYNSSPSDIEYILSRIAESLCVTEQEGQIYPTEYIPYKRLGFSVKKEYVNSDTFNLYIVDSQGNQIGEKVSFTVSNNSGDSPNVVISGYLNSVNTITYKLQPNSINEASIKGSGWSGDLSNGYTNIKGELEPLEFDLSHFSVGDKFILSFNSNGVTSDNTDLNICVGDSPTVKSYNGTNIFNIGLVANGGNLKIYPAAGFGSTITNIAIRKIDDNGTDSLTLAVNNMYVDQNKMVTAFWNVAIGSNSTLANLVNGSRNISIGNNSLNSITSGNRNVAIGTFSLPFVTEAEDNVAIGSDTVYPLKKAFGCVGIGKGTLGGNQEAEYCVAIGKQAMGIYTLAKDRKKCTVVGVNAGYAVTDSCTHVGYRAGANVSGAKNTSIGYGSMAVGERTSVDIVGEELTCVGYYSQIDNTTEAKSAKNSTAIGANTKITKSNQVVIGNSAVEEIILGGKKIIFNADGTCSWESV